MRKVIFTESQMRDILGEDFEAYLSNSGGNKEPYNSYGTEVTVGEKDAEGNSYDSTITDKISHSKASMYPIWGRGIRIFPDVQTPLREENQELKDRGKSFSMGNNIRQAAKQIANNNPNDKLMNNIATEKGATINDLYMRLDRLEKMRTTDQQRYNQIGGDRLARVIRSQIETAKKSSKSGKEFNKKMGMENSFQKPGGTKESGNGKAHTPKPKVAPPINP